MAHEDKQDKRRKRRSMGGLRGGVGLGSWFSNAASQPRTSLSAESPSLPKKTMKKRPSNDEFSVY